MPTGSPWRWTCHSLSSWDRDRQEWYATIGQALIDGRALPAPTGGDPFLPRGPRPSRRHPDQTGFTKIEITDVREPIY